MPAVLFIATLIFNKNFTYGWTPVIRIVSQILKCWWSNPITFSFTLYYLSISMPESAFSKHSCAILNLNYCYSLTTWNY